MKYVSRTLPNACAGKAAEEDAATREPSAAAGPCRAADAHLHVLPLKKIGLVLWPRQLPIAFHDAGAIGGELRGADDTA
jgi:hypothetical protein